MPSLNHTDKKDSTIKWFLIALIPILNLYYMWKLAESISGHKVGISNQYSKLEHMDTKDSTGKWFLIFLIPAILGLFIAIASGGMAHIGYVGDGAAIFGGTMVAIFAIVSFAIGIFILYKTALCISGHEQVFKEYEEVRHMDRKEDTIKWIFFGIIPILNLYFLWKAAEMVSGHEVIHRG